MKIKIKNAGVNLVIMIFVLVIILALTSYSVLAVGCLSQKPKYSDSLGNILFNYCFGADRVVGTNDDCGCATGLTCQKDGSCGRVCFDGTPLGECSATKPFLCDERKGILVKRSDVCGCPENRSVTSNGECAFKNEFLFSDKGDFIKNVQHNQIERGLVVTPTSFDNVAADKAAFVEGASVACAPLLTDGDANIGVFNYSSGVVNLYERFCMVPNAKKSSFGVNFGQLTKINSLRIDFGKPFISDYQVEYSDGANWKPLYTGHNDFNFPEKDYSSSYVSAPGYDKTDDKKIKYYTNRLACEKEACFISAFEGSYNGIDYMVIPVDIHFPTVNAMAIRVIPLNWQQGATLYEIEAYNADSHLELRRYSNLNNFRFTTSGNYTSPVIFANVSSSILTYTNLSWKISNFGLANVVNEQRLTTYGGPDFLDKDAVFNACYRYFGINGGPASDVPMNRFDDGRLCALAYDHYDSPRIDYPMINRTTEFSSLGYPEVFYDKNCVNDGKWEGENSNIDGINNKPCVASPGEIGYDLHKYPDNAEVKDSILSNHGAAFFGANVTNDTTRGKVGGFDGKNDLVLIPLSNSLKLSKDLTISVWVKPKTLSSTYNTILQGRNGDLLDSGYGLGLANGKVALKLYHSVANGYTQFNSSSSLPLNTWSYIAVTYNGSYAAIYVNGVISNSATVTRGLLDMNGDKILIGAYNYTNYFFNGSIDDAAIFNRALNGSEISSIYSGSALSSDKIVSHWKFNETSWNPWGDLSYYATVIRLFYLPAQQINRLVFSELQSKIKAYRIISANGDTEQVVYDDYSDSIYGSPNVRTIIDFSKITSQMLEVELFTLPGLQNRSPLLFEMAGYNVTYGIPPAPLNNDVFVTRFQLRSGQSEAEVLSAPWYGANGVFGGYFIAQNQSIGKIHDGNQYFQYKVVTSTPNQLYSPVIDDISIGYVGEQSQPPVASISASDTNILVNDIINFSGEGSFDPDGGIEFYHWNFGDGSTFDGATAQHQFKQAGEYEVTLSIIDSEGQRAYASSKVFVDVYDCLTSESTQNNLPVFPMTNPVVNQAAISALQEYADRNRISISQIVTSEQMVQAALDYLDTHMSYLSNDQMKSCAQANSLTLNINSVPSLPLSLPQALQYGNVCGCPDGALLCGQCGDYSVMFTTLVRAMGVNSKCVYSAISAPLAGPTSASLHAFNVVDYHGKFRIIEPQSSEVDHAFYSNVLTWNNTYQPYYLTGNLFNDKGVNSYTTVYSGSDTKSKILNYPGTTGLPDAGKVCDASSFNGYGNLNHDGRNGGWDSATLFADVCK